MTYRIYTTEFDEVVRPLDLVDQDELDKAADYFHNLCPVNDLQPLQDRLNQLNVPDRDVAVTLLIDNSGSMRGSSITFAIGTVGILGMYLDRLGVPNEILGFTSTTWKGGPVREKWIENGRPRDPGRLCAIRHIIYKTFDEQLNDVRNNLGLMMLERSLKENIDGEAVLWAVERLRKQSAKKRVLLVISDGAPCDDATLQVNHSGYSSGLSEEDQKLEDSQRRASDLPIQRTFNNYLSLHLRSVIADLNKAGDITLDAIGIGHNTEPYYGVGTYIKKVEDLAPTAIAKLEKLLQS